jgi:phospho-N-acetylmuramoyl-pentapeptide-transferase
MIKKFQKWEIRSNKREDVPERHEGKRAYPPWVFCNNGFHYHPNLMWSDLTNFYVWIVTFTLISFGAIGFIDDFKKLKNQNGKGIRGKTKLLMQLLFAVIISGLLYLRQDFITQLSLPFFKNITPQLGYFYILLSLFIIVGTSNAVNLTDGLDGLAIGPVITVSATFMLFSYIAGNIKFAQYLQIFYVRGAGELTIFCGAMLGAGIGFLWYNTYPAELFMGDTGSLSLGASLGTMAVIIKQEIVLFIAGGIFVLETMSVIIQVLSFKWRGKRVFKMAPLHHHFELKGWNEEKIVVRFWIISMILGLIALSTLKLR